MLSVYTAMLSLGGKAEQVRVNSLKSMVHVSHNASKVLGPLRVKQIQKQSHSFSPKPPKTQAVKAM